MAVRAFAVDGAVAVNASAVLADLAWRAVGGFAALLAAPFAIALLAALLALFAVVDALAVLAIAASSAVAVLFAFRLFAGVGVNAFVVLADLIARAVVEVFAFNALAVFAMGFVWRALADALAVLAFLAGSIAVFVSIAALDAFTVDADLTLRAVI